MTAAAPPIRWFGLCPATNVGSVDLIMSFMRNAALRIAAEQACVCLSQTKPKDCITVCYHGRAFGRCRQAVAEKLTTHGIASLAGWSKPVLEIGTARQSFSTTLAMIARVLVNSDFITTKKNFDEPISVGDDDGYRLGLSPRGLVLPLGISMSGVHLNGFVGDGSDGALVLAQRHYGHSTYAGHLDNLTAGVRRDGESYIACLTREASEEAGLPAALVAQHRIRGKFSFFMPTTNGFARGRAIVAELALPTEFKLVPQDGTVLTFHQVSFVDLRNARWPSIPFKPTAALAIIASLKGRRLMGSVCEKRLSTILTQASYCEDC